MPDDPPGRGLIDTSVIVDLEAVDPGALPLRMAVAAITLAELAAGPHATGDPEERARRQERLQLAENTFDVIPFDGGCARAYGRVYVQALTAGRKARGRRAVDLLTAATALATDLPLYTANPTDFEGLPPLIEVVPIKPPRPAR